jgi:hypothetical protein
MHLPDVRQHGDLTAHRLNDDRACLIAPDRLSPEWPGTIAQA